MNGRTKKKVHGAACCHCASFVITQLREFHTDPAVKNVKRLLSAIDGNGPARIVLELVDESSPASDESGMVRPVEFTISEQVLWNALTPFKAALTYFASEHLFQRQQRSVLELQVAAQFDAFLTHLMTLRMCTDREMVEERELGLHLAYWLQLISRPFSEFRKDAWEPAVPEPLIVDAEKQAKQEARAKAIRRKLGDYIQCYYGPGLLGNANLYDYIPRLYEQQPAEFYVYQ